MKRALIKDGWTITHDPYFIKMGVKRGFIDLGTDLKIALCLIEKGIDKKDIVLAFHSPARRKLIPEFAQD